MKSTHRTILLIVLILVALVMSLSGQTLKHDLNGIPMQFCRTFQADSLAIASTAFQEITVPAGAVEVTVWATALCAVTNLGVTNGLANNASDIAMLPANVPVRMSVASMTKLYARRSATATATILYLLWHSM